MICLLLNLDFIYLLHKIPTFLGNGVIFGYKALYLIMKGSLVSHNREIFLLYFHWSGKAANMDNVHSPQSF